MTTRAKTQPLCQARPRSQQGSDGLSDLALLTKRQLSRQLSVSPRTVDNWQAQKRIPYLRISPRLVRFDLRRVLAALCKYEIKSV
jgi:hypothetical protein